MNFGERAYEAELHVWLPSGAHYMHVLGETKVCRSKETATLTYVKVRPYAGLFPSHHSSHFVTVLWRKSLKYCHTKDCTELGVLWGHHEDHLLSLLTWSSLSGEDSVQPKKRRRQWACGVWAWESHEKWNTGESLGQLPQLCFGSAGLNLPPTFYIYETLMAKFPYRPPLANTYQIGTGEKNIAVIKHQS